MKKILSLLLIVMMLLGTLSVLLMLPSTVGSAAENSMPNLILNGDASGVSVGGALKLYYDESDRGEGYPTNSLLGYTYYYDNGHYQYNPYGWRNNDTRYNYISLEFNNSWPLNDSERFSNFSGDNAFRLKGWTQAMQNIEIEGNKIYKVSAKVTQRPTTATPTGDWQFDMFLDGKTATTAGASRPNGTSWNLSRGHSVLTDIISKFNNTSNTYVSNGSDNYYFGDFTEYSFTFNSNDFISANSLTKNQNGKYDARFVIMSASAAWLLFDDVSITEVIEVRSSAGGVFTGEVKSDGSASTLTAHPYYGNRFLGWFTTDGQLISESPVYSDVVSQSMIATFEQNNLIENGDFEAPNSAETAVIYNNYPKYSSSVYGTADIRDTCIAGSGVPFGEKCLSVTPNPMTTGNAANAKLKGLLNIPVSLEENTNYIWKFSYAFPDVTYNSQKHYIKFSVDNPQTSGTPGWNSTVDYSFHAQRPGMDGVDEWGFSWGRNVANSGTLENLGASAGNEWVDMYIIFTTTEAGTYFLTLGTTQALTDSLVLDNMSLTKAVNSGAATTVAVEGNGEVYSYRTDEQALRATEARGSETVFQTLEAAPYYPQMYVTFTAKAQRGNVFTGWYDENDALISTEKTLTTWSTDKKYTAKFAVDETKYTVSAIAKDNGGFITDDTDETEFYRDDTITLTAHPYRGNTFLGWYQDGNLVCSEEIYKVNIQNNVNLVAHFNIGNLFADSGFENTEAATSLWGSDKTWYTDGDATATYGDVVSNTAATGKNSLAVRAPGLNIIHKPIAVAANTDYHFSFDWRTANAYTDDNLSGLSKVSVVDANTGAVLAEDTTFKPSLGAAFWQQAFLNFNTGSATSVKIVVSYNAKASAFFLDNLTLFTTADNKFDIICDSENKDGNFAGYVTCDKKQSVSLGDSVTISATPYDRNAFMGWLENGRIVSTNLVYTFSADHFRNLTAVFEYNNLVSDSGFENTALDSKMPTDTWINGLSNGYFKVSGTGTFDGNKLLEINHKNREFTYKIKGLEKRSYYVFSFMWKLSETETDSVFDYISVVGGRTLLEYNKIENVAVDADWQKTTLYFNTHQDTDFDIKMFYSASRALLLMDNVTLYKANNVLVTSAEGGSVTTSHNGPVDVGTTVTATAVPEAGNTFKGWYNYNNPKELLSTDTTYSFVVSEAGVNEIIAYYEGETAEEINYFADGGFENKTGLDIVFSHPTWTNIDDDYYEYVATTTSGATPVSGDNMLAIQANGHYTNLLIPGLKPQTEYTLSLWLYLENNAALNMFSVMPYYPERGSGLNQANQGATNVRYQEFDAGAAASMANSLVYMNGMDLANGEWRKIELQFNSGRTPTIYLHITASILGIPYYIDDMRITEGTSGYSDTLVNGDFSDSTAENGWLTDYTATTEADNTYATVNDTLKQNLLLKDTRGYTLSFRARSQDGAKLLFGLTNGGTNALTTQNAITNVAHNTATLGNEWKEYTLNFSTTNYKFTSLYFTTLNGKAFQIDDVKLDFSTDITPVEQFTFEDSEHKFSFVPERGIAAIVSNNNDWYEYSREEAHNGSYSLKMKHRDTYAPHALIQDWTTLSLFSGRTYKMSFWAKGAAGDQFRFRIMTNDKNWEAEARIDSTETLENNEWNQYTYYFTVDYIEFTSGKQVEFSIDGVEGKSTADMYFDDFYIEENERSVTNHTATLLYTQDLSQNYFENYNFEKDGDAFEPFVREGDAFFGKRYITVNAGDRILLPVTTRTDITYPFHAQYTFAASIRSNSISKGIVSLAFDKDGKKLLKDKNGKEANLLTNTSGSWTRSGFSFEDTNETTLYLVIECESGSFDVDYLALFNNLRAYENNTHDLKDYFFDKDNPDNYVDAGSFADENLLLGTISGLPEGSKIILSGEQNYESTFDAEGNYSLRNIKNGTYNMLVHASDAKFATMWGTVTFLDGKASGLALTRLNGDVLKIEGPGVENGVARIDDTSTNYGYLTATDDEGYFTAYIIDSDWAVIGTTRQKEILQKYSLKFQSPKVYRVAIDPDIVSVKTVSFSPVWVILLALLSMLTIALTFKKGECK